MASSPAQGQEDVAAPARPAVRRRPLDDLPADPRRPDAVARHRHEAGPRPARAARRRRHARSTSASSPSGSTNPTARVEYALRADELLSEPQVRQIMEYYLAVRMRRYGRPFQPTESASRQRRSTGRAPRWAVRPRRPPDGRRRSSSAGRRRASDPFDRSHAQRGAASRAATEHPPGHDPDRPPRPGLGDSERRRLGRRRSHFRVRGQGSDVDRDAPSGRGLEPVATTGA